ncbi:FCD domain-containing protein [Streptosporangium sp. NPDC006007]|uniref:FCD domain-containing protein n=1 Tax=Streptosporangium sp. NPDC006007 TaxID=3154575 RepID=UPI0033A2B471
MRWRRAPRCRKRLYAVLAAETRLGLVRLRAVYPDREVLVAEHRDLLEAIGRGPVEDARRAVAAHLDHGWGERRPRAARRRGGAGGAGSPERG